MKAIAPNERTEGACRCPCMCEPEHHAGNCDWCKSEKKLIAVVPNQAREHLMKTLEDVLAEAKAGKWDGVAMITFKRLEGGDIGSDVWFSGEGSAFEKIGLVQSIATRMAQR